MVRVCACRQQTADLYVFIQHFHQTSQWWQGDHNLTCRRDEWCHQKKYQGDKGSGYE